MVQQQVESNVLPMIYIWLTPKEIQVFNRCFKFNLPTSANSFS